MNEELINEIVRRILAEPSLQEFLQGSRTQEGSRVLQSKALVLLNYASNFQCVLSAVQRQFGDDFKLSVLPSDQVFLNKPELPIGMTWITLEDAVSQEDWSKLILPACSANTLAKAALGLRDNPFSEIIGRGISKGNSIEIATEYLGLTPQTPQAYREMYEGYIRKLQSYGVIITSQLSSVSAEPRQKPIAMESVEPRDEVHYPKKFLGDKQACGFPEGATVYVRQGTIISPLARDTLRMHRIELCFEKEERR